MQFSVTTSGAASSASRRRDDHYNTRNIFDLIDSTTHFEHLFAEQERIESRPVNKHFLRLLKAINAKDTFTGLDFSEKKAQHLNVIRKKMIRHKDAPDLMPFALVKADISNLRGLNIFLSGQDISDPEASYRISQKGEDYANKVMSMMAKIYRTRLNALAESHHGGFRGYRVGGDEWDAFLLNVPEKEITATLQQIESETAELIDELGLKNIMHAKYTRDLERRGVGITCATGMYDARKDALSKYAPGAKKDSYMTAFSKAVDEEVETRKKHRLENASPISLESSSLSLANLASHVFASEHPAEAGRPDHAYNPEMSNSGGMLTQASPEELNTLYAKIDEKFKATGCDQPDYTIPDWPFSKEPTAPLPKKYKDLFVHPKLKRKLQVIHLMHRLHFTPEEERSFLQYVQMFETNDQLTGFSKERIEAVLQEAKEYLDARPNENMLLVCFSIENMSGLNKLGHDFCDGHLKNIAGIIENSNQDKRAGPEEKTYTDSMIYRPFARGERVYALLPHLSNTQAYSIIREASIKTEAYARRHSLNAIPHGREGKDETMRGVHLTAAALSLNQRGNQTTEVLLQHLNNQLADHKARRMSFDGHRLYLPDHVPIVWPEALTAAQTVLHSRGTGPEEAAR